MESIFNWIANITQWSLVSLITSYLVSLAVLSFVTLPHGKPNSRKFWSQTHAWTIVSCWLLTILLWPLINTHDLILFIIKTTLLSSLCCGVIVQIKTPNHYNLPGFWLSTATIIIALDSFGILLLTITSFLGLIMIGVVGFIISWLVEQEILDQVPLEQVFTVFTIIGIVCFLTLLIWGISDTDKPYWPITILWAIIGTIITIWPQIFSSNKKQLQPNKNNSQ